MRAGRRTDRRDREGVAFCEKDAHRGRHRTEVTEVTEGFNRTRH